MVYFIGIGGIGMSALARYFVHEGKQVAGYDRTPTPLTAALEAEGIAVHYHDDENNIPPAFRSNDVFVIYTPAVGNDNAELRYFRQNGNKIVKRSEALGHITSTKKLLAVAGTHGKTTTSTLLAHILTNAGDGCSAFLGGISKNYDSNLLLNKEAKAIVAEADEFDRSFLQLHPDIAIVTSVDADHLDIYGNLQAMEQSFKDFVNQIKPGGTLIIKKKLTQNGKPAFMQHFSDKRMFTYSYNEPADFYAKNIKEKQGGYFEFDLVTPMGIIPQCIVGIPGWVNVENAVAASAAALVHGIHKHYLPRALQSFRGVQRRFDIQFSSPNVTYIDDYAHHPEELKAAISSIRNIFPTKKITGIFQPHLYTRTRDFAQGFGESLSALDELILLDIYPARELPIEGVSSGIIFDHVSIENKRMCAKQEVLDILRAQPREVIVTLGAGDIDTLVAPIKNMLESE